MFNQQKPTTKKIASNMYELELEYGTVLISYQTPVAFRGVDGYYKTSKKHSSTTSRQITKLGGKEYPTNPQEFFDNLTA